MYREKIDAYIEGKREEILADLMDLVKIDSQRGQSAPGKPFGEGPAQVIAAAEDLMKQYGLTVTNYDQYCVTGDLSQKKKALDILAHLDVVPVTEDWTVTKPFCPLIKDGRIYGRGTADDKGPALAALYAMRAVKELQIPLKYSVRLILGSDEECGSSDLEYYYAKEEEAPYSFTPDADFPLINLEKARLAKSFTAKTAHPCDGSGPALLKLQAGDKVNVVPAKAYASVGGLSLSALQKAWEAFASGVHTKDLSCTFREQGEKVDILVKGIAAHASTPQLGVNALTAMLGFLSTLPFAQTQMRDLLSGLARLFPQGDTTGQALGIAMADEESGALTMNLGILNYEEGVFYGEYDVRAPLCATNENLTRVVKEALAGAGFAMEEGDLNPAHYVPADSFLVRTLLGSYEKYFGKKGEALAIGGGTYVHHLERGVAFGCMVEGVDNHMHGDDEFMEIDMLLKSAKIFADAIVTLCGEDAPEI